ncbi:hypothetical protein F0562_018962 [Nyssa sinensis]|uniref:Uncharacterized protein n=1 Tax=Nyssa sinensis TaxID=561372 RepID=A0A5J4ZDP6_9ASTE|nr:hypothetical protein F0562_018962 [Nyssa sinensis]
MSGDEDTASGWLQATIAAMVGAVAKKNTEIRAVIHFMGVVWAQVRPTGAAKGTKKRIIWRLVEEAFKRGCVLNDGRGESIDEIGGSGEGVIPILVWDRGSRHKGEASLNDVAMAALDRTILFLSVGAGQTMEDARVSKMRLSSVGIDCKGKVMKTGGDVMSSTGVRIPVLVIVSCKRWSRRCGGVRKVGLGSGGGRGVKMVVEAIPTSGSVKNGGRHAPCRGICYYSEEHCDGKKNHDDRDQRRRLQGVPKVVEVYPFAESWLCQYSLDAITDIALVSNNTKHLCTISQTIDSRLQAPAGYAQETYTGPVTNKWMCRRKYWLKWL